MGSLGPTHLISLLLAVAIIAATCGFIASAVVRRNKRRARGFFLLGFFCGLMAGAILRGRRRGLNALGAVARCADVRPLRAGIRRGTGRFAARALTSAATSCVTLVSLTPGRELGTVRECRPDPGLSFLRTALWELRFGSCTRSHAGYRLGSFSTQLLA